MYQPFLCDLLLLFLIDKDGNFSILFHILQIVVQQQLIWKSE
jgi:hypothetical protein